MSFIFNPDDFDHSNRIHLLEKKVDSIIDGKLAARVAGLDKRVRSLEGKSGSENSSYAPIGKGFVIAEVAKVVGIFSMYAQPLTVISTLKNEMMARTGLPTFELLLDTEDFDKLMDHHTIRRLIEFSAKVYGQMSLGQKLKSITRMMSVDSIVINESVAYPVLRAYNATRDLLND